MHLPPTHTPKYHAVNKRSSSPITHADTFSLSFFCARNGTASGVDHGSHDRFCLLLLLLLLLPTSNQNFFISFSFEYGSARLCNGGGVMPFSPCSAKKKRINYQTNNNIAFKTAFTHSSSSKKKKKKKKGTLSFLHLLIFGQEFLQVRRTF